MREATARRAAWVGGGMLVLTLSALLGTAAGCGETTSPKPIDLTAEWVTFDGPGAVEPDAVIPIRIQSYVTGEAARWPVRVYLSADAQIAVSDIGVVDAEAVPAMAGGRGAFTDVMVPVPAGTAAGVYYLGAILDPEAQLPDTNRSDNAAASTMVIGVGVPVSDVTEAPTPLAPPDRALFDVYPRVIELDWTDVGGAMSYDVQVDGGDLWAEPHWWDTTSGWFVWEERIVATSGWTTDFVGAQPGRWRVRGLDARGVAGPASAWQVFLSLR